MMLLKILNMTNWLKNAMVSRLLILVNFTRKLANTKIEEIRENISNHDKYVTTAESN